nr:pitrilysin family protein [Tomitella biformata]
MGVRRTVLPGGLRVVTEHVPGVRSASVGVWVGVGSRDESASVAGAAHFLEHLLFKRTPTRTATDIAESVDAIGGELNAFTTKEYTCFYAHVLDEDLALAVDVVADVVLRGRCDTDDVELERGVVLEEIAMRDDDPEDLVADLLTTSLFGDHPLGRPVIGTDESIEAMTRNQIHSFHKRRYQPRRMVVAVAGNVDHDVVVELTRLAFADAITGPGADGVEPDRCRGGKARFTGRPQVLVRPHDGEQVHLSLGVRTLGRHDPGSRWALAVLNHAVGGGLSSRLFQEIRELRGLAYSVYSSVDTFADAGAFSVYAGCQPENVGEVAAQIRAVLEDVRENGLTEQECARSRGALRGGLVLGLEDSNSRMNRIGGSELNLGRHSSVAGSLDRIAAVTSEDVSAMAARLLAKPLGGVVLGPYEGVADLPSELRAMVS